MKNEKRGRTPIELTQEQQDAVNQYWAEGYGYRRIHGFMVSDGHDVTLSRVRRYCNKLERKAFSKNSVVFEMINKFLTMKWV